MKRKMKKYVEVVDVKNKTLIDQIQAFDENGNCYIIPFDEDNTDYQEFKKWKAKGNKPEKPNNNGGQ
jgi:ABC-type tungstate transport system permease subunit